MFAKVVVKLNLLDGTNVFPKGHGFLDLWMWPLAKTSMPSSIRWVKSMYGFTERSFSNFFIKRLIPILMFNPNFGSGQVMILIYHEKCSKNRCFGAVNHRF